jgi:hypothetical protein
MFKVDYGDFGLPAQFAMAVDYACNVNCPDYTQANGGLDLNSFGQGSLGGSFQTSVGQGWNYGVENVINDNEVVQAGANFATGTLDGQSGVFYDACDPTAANAPVSHANPAPNPRWDGTYLINVTSVTDATGVYTLPFSINQEKKDSRIQVEAFVGASGGATAVTVNACAFSSTVDNFAYHISTGLVTQRAPIFAVAQVKTSLSIVTSQQRVVQLRAQFKDASGVVSKPVVLLTQGAGSAARNVLGGGGGPQTGTTAGWLNYSRTVCFTNGACSATSALLSLSQGLTFNYLPADTRYAYSGIDQLFAKSFASPSNPRGVYWLAPTFEALLAKLPMSTTIAYLYLPTSTAFLKVSVSNDLVSPGGTTTATVTVYSSLTGTTLSGASVWIGNQQIVTNATGDATFTIAATALGAQEALVVATAPYGGVARGWYALVATNPVLTYSSIAVTAAQAGSASTITVSAQNTLPVSGNATVWLVVDNQAVAGQVVAFAASETKTVTFTYVFAQAGSHTVAVGAASTQASIAAVPPADNTLLYALAGGLLVVGLILGVVVGRMGRKRKGPPTSMPEESGGGMGGTAEEELSPEDKL